MPTFSGISFTVFACLGVSLGVAATCGPHVRLGARECLWHTSRPPDEVTLVALATCKILELSLEQGLNSGIAGSQVTEEALLLLHTALRPSEGRGGGWGGGPLLASHTSFPFCTAIAATLWTLSAGNGQEDDFVPAREKMQENTPKARSSAQDSALIDLLARPRKAQPSQPGSTVAVTQWPRPPG